MGESFRFIHCSDLHLGCGFSGISKNDPSLGKRLRESVFEALDKIVHTAKKEKADFVIFSGDIFDSENETPLTRSRFAEALAAIKVPCYIAYGNHDAKRRWESSIPLPKNAYVFPEEITHIYAEKNGTRLAEIIGCSFRASSPDADVTENVAKESDLFGIGVFHCTVDGASENNYAPCKLLSLRVKKLDYWALGHIHKREILSQTPYVVYSGNTQGMDPKESGEKGAYLVIVENGKVKDMRFFRTGPVQWQDVECDMTGMTDLKQLTTAISSQAEKGAMVSLRLTGRTQLDSMLRIDPEGFKEVLYNALDCNVVSVNIRTVPDIDLDAREDTGDFISAVLNYSRRVSQFKREELLNIICSTTTANNIRDRFEEFSDEELRDIVKDASYLIVEKMMEAER